ncbi:hypothetical protein [Prochlorococcus marinus]|nr:hypothetical protein [Prochlorococcus marinus]
MSQSLIKFPLLIFGFLTLSSCSLFGETFIDPNGNKMIIKKREVICTGSRGENVNVGIFPGIRMNAWKKDDTISCFVQYQFKDKNGMKRKSRLESDLMKKTGLHYCAVQRPDSDIEFVNNDTLTCKIANEYGKVKAAIKEAQKWDNGAFQGLGREQKNY